VILKKLEFVLLICLVMGYFIFTKGFHMVFYSTLVLFLAVLILVNHKKVIGFSIE